jgi:hypothetical protein
MKQYLWKQRPLLIFAPGDTAELRRQRADIEKAIAGMEERDMAVVEIVGDRVTMITGPDCDDDAEGLRRFADFGRSDFGVVLVGKDGGIKLVAAEPVTMDRIFRLIDSMPMRRQEMASGTEVTGQ